LRKLVAPVQPLEKLVWNTNTFTNIVYVRQTQANTLHHLTWTFSIVLEGAWKNKHNCRKWELQQFL